MKDFTDALLDTILKQEIPKIDKIMKNVTENVAEDLLQKTIRLLDSYYDNYIPVRYVRLYEPKRKLALKSKKKTNAKSKAGGVSLHTAIERMEGNDLASISIGDFNSGYTGGIVFDSSYFQSHMRHPGAGISGWNMVGNFLFSASDGTGNHPMMRRLVEDDGVSGESDAILDAYLNNYDTKIDQFYKDACKKYR